jgi:signal transduction histidine kinase
MVKLLDIRLDQIAVVGAPPARRARDWWLVGGLAVIVGIDVALRTVLDDTVTRWLYLSLMPAAVALVAVLVRRQLPVFAACATFIGEGIFGIARRSDELLVDTTLGHDAATAIVLYALCRWATPKQIAAGFAISATFAFVGDTAGGGNFVSNLGFLVGWLVVAAAALAMRYRARLLYERQMQVRLEERHSLARELHDTVAHHVSAIAVQAQAAQFVASTDPVAATEAMRNVEQIANTAIDEMRRMVGILRSADDEVRSVTPKSLAELADASGSPQVSIVGEHDLSGLPSPIASAVYRLTQESITNARRHSRHVTFIDVDLEVGDDGVDLRIDNDGAPTTRSSGSGYGLIGMQERVDALGGELQAGPRAASGWQVTVQLPNRRGSDPVRP